MSVRISQAEKEAMKQQLKQDTKRKRKNRKSTQKAPTPEVNINDNYKVKITKYSYDLFRKQEANETEEEELDSVEEGEIEPGWICLGHFCPNSWDRIRTEVFNDLIYRKATQEQKMELERFARICDTISKEVVTMFSSNNDIIFHKTKTQQTK